MKTHPRPPMAYTEFIERYPLIGEAWEKLAEAGHDGPLTKNAVRLIKLGIAIGAMREGAVRSNVRKAFAEEITEREIEQVIALAASTIGLPSTVAIYSWFLDVKEKSQP